MKAYLTPKGLLIKSGKIVFQSGKMPKEDMLWVPADHVQFDAAVDWATTEGLL